MLRCVQLGPFEGAICFLCPFQLVTACTYGWTRGLLLRRMQTMMGGATLHSASDALRRALTSLTVPCHLVTLWSTAVPMACIDRHRFMDAVLQDLACILLGRELQVLELFMHAYRGRHSLLHVSCNQLAFYPYPNSRTFLLVD